MQVVETPLPGVKIVQPVVHRDPRGFFLETYHHQRYTAAGIPDVFVQDNHSKSVRGTLRGLHLGSPTFGQWTSARLSDENAWQMYVPGGFAHGFAVISDVAEVEYKCSAFYDAADEMAIKFDDPAIGVEWPVTAPILSKRDQEAKLLADVMSQLPPFPGA